MISFICQINSVYNLTIHSKRVTNLIPVTSIRNSSKTLTELAPELEGVLNQSHFVGVPPGGATAQLADVATLRADNQALKEVLEKERFRRKVKLWLLL